MVKETQSRSTFPAPPFYYKLFGDSESASSKDVGESASTPRDPPAVPDQFMRFGGLEHSNSVITTGEPVRPLDSLVSPGWVPVAGGPALADFDGAWRPVTLIEVASDTQWRVKDSSGDLFTKSIAHIRPPSPPNLINKAASYTRSELKRFLKSSVDNYLDILQRLVSSKARDSTVLAEKCKRIHDNMTNMCHILNSLRPHQARGTLAAVLRWQLKERQKKAADLSAMCDKIEAYLSKPSESSSSRPAKRARSAEALKHISPGAVETARALGGMELELSKLLSEMRRITSPVGSKRLASPQDILALSNRLQFMTATQTQNPSQASKAQPPAPQPDLIARSLLHRTPDELLEILESTEVAAQEKSAEEDDEASVLGFSESSEEEGEGLGAF